MQKRQSPLQTQKHVALTLPTILDFPPKLSLLQFLGIMLINIVDITYIKMNNGKGTARTAKDVVTSVLEEGVL